MNKTIEERRAEVAARKPQVVLDWDGTLVENAWPECGDWKPGAIEAIESLLNAGYRVIVHSCRTHTNDVDDKTPLPPGEVEKQVQAIRSMLDAADLGIVDIYASNKPPADFYVDDKAVRFEGDWKKVLCKIADKLDPGGAAGGEQRRDAVRQIDEITDEFNTFEVAARYSAPEIRTFETGATRNLDADKYDYEAYLSPLVIRRYAEYMAKHAVQADGSVRDGDNWQKGIPLNSFASSGWRHFMDWWLEHRGHDSREGLEEALCGLLFNAMGYLHETLKDAA